MDPLFLWGVGLLAAGFLVLLAELFVPSAGVLTMVAGVLAVSGVVCLFRYDTIWGVIGLLTVVVGGPIMGFFGLKIMPNTPVGRRLILGNPADDDEGPIGTGTSAGDQAAAALLDRHGEVVADLRPVGVVRIEGKRYDAISEVGFLRAGQPVRVTGVERGGGGGVELRVRPLG